MIWRACLAEWRLDREILKHAVAICTWLPKHVETIKVNGAPDLEIYRRDGDEHTVH